MNLTSVLTPTGSLGLRVSRAADRGIVRTAPIAWKLKNFFAHRLRGLWEQIGLAFVTPLFGISTLSSKLFITVTRATGEIIDYGCVSTRKVTATGMGFIVDAFQNSTELENMKYHALGTGSGAESNADTALNAEITANHYTANRPTGSTEEGASAWIYKTIGTHTQATAGDAITEHAVVSTATSTYVMLDRHLFAAINLAVGDSLASTYQLTLTPEA
jgi:hypothetical protein